MVQYLIPYTVDLVLNILLNTFEESSDVEVIVHPQSGSSINIVTASDGLAGELWGKSGWIKRFSDERSSEEV